MKIEKYKHTGVNPDGTLKSGGAVQTVGMISMSAENGGCGMPSCSCSPGYWISISFPRTKSGKVEGIKIQFENKKEFEDFFKYKQLICQSKKK